MISLGDLVDKIERIQLLRNKIETVKREYGDKYQDELDQYDEFELRSLEGEYIKTHEFNED